MERTEVAMVVLIGLVVYLLGVDIRESAMGAFLGEDKTWTPTLDRVHGPLSWTGSMDPLLWTGSMDRFFLIMRNEQKQDECKNKVKKQQQQQQQTMLD